MFEKFKSRKFLMALSAQIVGLIVLFYPEHQGEIESASTNVMALLFMALTAAGWIKAEGVIDANREAQNGQITTTKMHIEQQERQRQGNTPGGGTAAGLILLCLLLLPAFGCTALQGSAATELDAWYELRADLNAANRTYIAFANSGDLNDPEHAERVLEWGQRLQTARALLAQARPLADQPGDGFDDLFNQIEAILIGLAGPTSELQDDGTTSPDRRPAWRLRDRQRDQPPAGPSGSGWRDHASAA